ncbi:MAG: fumarylacetoacetate hydrolase family protein [Halioglobus sp.]
MNDTEIAQAGEELHQALLAQRTLAPFTERFSDITIDEAYRISLKMIDCRVRAGEKIIGKKIGVTSKPVQDMLGVFQPDFGFLTDGMVFADGADISIAEHLIQPRAEGEIAFRLKADLVGPGVTEAQVLAATESIMPCFEIVDSRIDDWKIKIEDTVADNASCGVYVLGAKEVDPHDYDLPNLHMRVFKNGELNSEGLGSAVQGNPLASVAWLANTLGEYGIPLKAGEVILSGSLVPLIPVVAGDRVSLEIDGIGGCSCNFV